MEELVGLAGSDRESRRFRMMASEESVVMNVTTDARWESGFCGGNDSLSPSRYVVAESTVAHESRTWLSRRRVSCMLGRGKEKGTYEDLLRVGLAPKLFQAQRLSERAVDLHSL
jgi:hypothetical protein